MVGPDPLPRPARAPLIQRPLSLLPKLEPPCTGTTTLTSTVGGEMYVDGEPGAAASMEPRGEVEELEAMSLLDARRAQGTLLARPRLLDGAAVRPVALTRHILPRCPSRSLLWRPSSCLLTLVNLRLLLAAKQVRKDSSEEKLRVEKASFDRLKAKEARKAIRVVGGTPGRRAQPATPQPLEKLAPTTPRDDSPMFPLTAKVVARERTSRDEKEKAMAKAAGSRRWNSPGAGRGGGEPWQAPSHIFRHSGGRPRRLLAGPFIFTRYTSCSSEWASCQ